MERYENATYLDALEKLSESLIGGFAHFRYCLRDIVDPTSWSWLLVPRDCLLRNQTFDSRHLSALPCSLPTGFTTSLYFFRQLRIRCTWPCIYAIFPVCWLRTLSDTDSFPRKSKWLGSRYPFSSGHAFDVRRSGSQLRGIDAQNRNATDRMMEQL